MKIVYLAGLCITLAACGGKKISIKDITAGTTGMHMQILKPQSDSVAVSFRTDDQKLIIKMTDFMNSAATPEFKCGYEGRIQFLERKDTLLKVDFIMNDPACMHFSYLYKGKIYTAALSAEAKQFIQELYKF